MLCLLTILLCVLQVHELANPGAVYEECMNLMTRLAQLGLVHCDFNEFNLLVSRKGWCGWAAGGLGKSMAVKVTPKHAHSCCYPTSRCLLLEGLMLVHCTFRASNLLLSGISVLGVPGWADPIPSMLIPGQPL